MIELLPGKIYKRTDLHETFRGQQQGGISTPAGHPVILLFTGDQGTQYGYHDGFQDDDIFLYTGEGQVGDMQMVRGNWAIRYHQENGKQLHLFLYIDRGMVQYVGQAYYVAHHTRPAPDRNGDQRSAIVFELSVDAPAVGVPHVRPVDRPAKLSSLWNRSMVSLRDEAYTASTKTAPSIEKKTVVHHRSEAVRIYVLRRSQGLCEGCGEPAPFKTPQRIPYLEPHHIRRRADSGPDHPRWVIALCPNCHARVHFGVDGAEYNIALGDRVEEIEDSLPIFVMAKVS